MLNTIIKIMKISLFRVIKFLVITFIFILHSTQISYAEKIKKFKIIGNDRVSDQTIIMFSNLNLNDKITPEILNNALKELYYTNYFDTVTVTNNSGIIEFSVVENPIIEEIQIEGIDNKKILENLKKITKKSEKYPFIENTINDQVTLIKNILKSYGYYFVELRTKANKNNNNSINIIYEIKLGEIAKIQKIKFIGKKFYKDRTLRNVILSEETKFWKFITRNKFLDQNRVNLDINRLNKFYKDRGFYNVKIKSSSAIIKNENFFELIFNIESGEKFFFNNIVIDKPIENLDLNIDFFNKKFKNLKGKLYSRRIVSEVIDDVNNFILENEFVFINANFKEIIKDNNKIDILIKFDDLDKFYVDRINIFGNYITDEKVIRNSFIVDEGDPFNKILFEKSVQDIKSKNIFKSVKFETLDNNNLDKIINITVEEKPTGEIFAGAGTGTTGSSLTAGIKENNYLGLGIKLDTNFTLTDDSLKGKFSVLNPNYKNSDKSLKTILESSTSDFMSSSGYKSSRTGISFGTEFEQFKDLFVNLEISNFYEDLETSSNASNILKKQEGDYFENLLTYNVKINRLNNNFQPTNGFINNFSQTLPIYSDDSAIENFLSSSKYHSISDDLILSAKFLLKTINSLDDNVRVSKRVFIPSRRLRGFESGKIGPKDGSQFIGGNYAASLNLGSTIPNAFFENENIDLNFFIDLANVWEVDYDDNLESNKIRSAAGLAVNWFSGIGPLTFSYAIPLSEADTDITEKFRFTIGTSF